jgi:DNA modification methylase
MTYNIDQIPISYDEIPQELLDITNKSRANFFTWNGQFSPQFIEVLIERYTSYDSKIFDPFLGSGTVLFEAARKNINASGIELNPSAYYMAKIYELSNISEAQRTVLAKKFDKLVFEICRSDNIMQTIVNKLNSLDEKYINDTFSLLVVLFDISNNGVTVQLITKKWSKIRDIITSLPHTTQPIVANLGDSRNINLPNDEIDLVITSPPYVNVFNYHQNYRKSVELLGFDMLQIARKELGSNRKNRSNRLLTLIQYCIDMSLVFSELIRICNKNARMIIVIGKESNILSYSFSNSEIIYLLAKNIFGLTLLLRQQRSFKNKFGQIISEDILHFSNNKVASDIPKDYIISQAKGIARTMLEDKLVAINPKDETSFLYAIQNFNSVKPSEGLL